MCMNVCECTAMHACMYVCMCACVCARGVVGSKKNLSLFSPAYKRWRDRERGNLLKKGSGLDLSPRGQPGLHSKVRVS